NHAEFTRADIRVDGGVREGDTISPFYDPMIAKLIVRGRDRREARARMLRALGEMRVAGLQTNIAFLRRLIADEAFATADLDTGLIERRHDALFPSNGAVPAEVLALAATALLQTQGYAGTGGPSAQTPRDPWDIADGWRVAGLHHRIFNFLDTDSNAQDVQLTREGKDWNFIHDEAAQTLEWVGETVSTGRVKLRLRLGGHDHTGEVLLQGETLAIYVDGEAYSLRLHDAVAHAQDDAVDHGGSLTAPMPGKIISVVVQQGDQVKSGDALLVMEAMKMEHTIHAPKDGVVEEIFYQPGDQVVDGAQLIAI